MRSSTSNFIKLSTYDVEKSHNQDELLGTLQATLINTITIKETIKEVEQILKLLSRDIVFITH